MAEGLQDHGPRRVAADRLLLEVDAAARAGRSATGPSAAGRLANRTEKPCLADDRRAAFPGTARRRRSRPGRARVRGRLLDRGEVVAALAHRAAQRRVRGARLLRGGGRLGALRAQLAGQARPGARARRWAPGCPPAARAGRARRRTGRAAPARGRSPAGRGGSAAASSAARRRARRARRRAARPATAAARACRSRSARAPTGCGRPGRRGRPGSAPWPGARARSRWPNMARSRPSVSTNF